MASRVLIGAEFSADIVAFLRLLARHRVRYLLVGGEAVIYHGYPRVTGDVDFFYENNSRNVRSLFSALEEFWEGAIPGVAAADELAEEGVIIQFGRPPHRIDLLNQIDGVNFDAAWPERIRVQLQTPTGPVPVYYIDALSLLTNKEAAARPKDLEDAAYLRAKTTSARRRKPLR